MSHIRHYLVFGLALCLIVPAHAQQSASPPTGNVSDPFPATDAKFFTAPSPTVETVDAFLKALWGYDANRIWRVMGIQTTESPGVSKVVVLVYEKLPNSKVQSTTFLVMADGKHASADGAGIIPFGVDPFADVRSLLEPRVDGPTQGAVGSDLTLVQFTDLQCPSCKEAQRTMNQLKKDFPTARLVFQPYPQVEIHSSAFKAAAFGVCVQKRSNELYFQYADEVFGRQGELSPATEDNILYAAVSHVGLDPSEIAACANSQATRSILNADIKLANEAGVQQLPTLSINGRMIPMSQVPYETLKQIVEYQVSFDRTNAAHRAAARNQVGQAQTQSSVAAKGDARSKASSDSPERGIEPDNSSSSRPPSSLPSIPRNYALIFATDDYAHWPHLTNPIPDADALNQTLGSLYGFQVEEVRNASNDQILTKLTEYLHKGFQPQDQLLIFFSGHGYFDNDLGQGFIVPANAPLVADDLGHTHLLAHDTIMRYVNRIPSKHVVLIIDACFAGTLDRRIADSGLRGDPADFYAHATLPELLARKEPKRTRRYFASGGKDFVPDGLPGHHSPFMSALLVTLNQAADRKGYATLDDIQQGLNTVNPEPRWGDIQDDNEPGADFLLLTPDAIAQLSHPQ